MYFFFPGMYIKVCFDRMRTICFAWNDDFDDVHKHQLASV